MDSDQKTLINELTQGKELANQLRNHLNPSSSPKTREFLIQKILSTYEKALSMLNCSASLVEPKLHATVSESPFFPNAGPKSEASDQDCKDQCLNKDVYKKRKTLPQWSEQVKVCSGTGLEGPLDDGYCWRKYGQKDILGANYPRGYYRCTHRHAQGCLATKLVQRSDEDPTIFEVTYRGRHTCSQNTQLSWASALSTKAKPKDEQNRYHQQQEQEEKPKQLREMMTNFGTSELKVKTEDLDNKDEIFPLFSFPQAFSEPENVEQDIFGESMLENNFIGSFSPSFFSPTTSESNYFSVSPCHVSNSFGLDQTVNTSESGVSETISAPNSVTNSPIGDFDFSLAKVDLDPNFPFDNLEFFS